MSNEHYKVSDFVLKQRDLKIPRDSYVFDAICTGEYFPEDPNEGIIVVALKGKLVQLNLTSAMIFEMIEAGFSVNSIEEKLVTLFSDTNTDELKDDIGKTIEQLCDYSIILKSE